MSQRDLMHEFRNCPSGIADLCDRDLRAILAGGPARLDILKIHKAARTALVLAPDLPGRLAAPRAGASSPDGR